jgi:hypothetical protein
LDTLDHLDYGVIDSGEIIRVNPYKTRHDCTSGTNSAKEKFPFFSVLAD